MFYNLAGIPMYGLFQGVAVVVFFVLAQRLLAAVPRVDSAEGARKAHDRSVIHALLLTGLYICCNFVASKILFDLRTDPAAMHWSNYFRPQHYFDGGFWGWPAVFLPLAMAYPFMFGLSRLGTYRAIALTLPVVIVVQKLACMAAGCCTGVETDLPWAMVFPEESQCPTPGVPVHPVPLYDGLFAVATYGVLIIMDRSAAGRAYLFPAFVALYGVNRLVTEFLRPEYEGTLNTRQILAGGVAVAFLGLLLVGRGAWRAILGRPSQTDPRPIGRM